MIITDFIFSYFQVTSKKVLQTVYIKRVSKNDNINKEHFLFEKNDWTLELYIFLSYEIKNLFKVIFTTKILYLFIFHCLFSIFGGLPKLFADLLGFSWVVSDQNIIEDGSGLDLPQVESDLADLVVFAQFLCGVGVELWVRDHGVNPFALVGWIVNLEIRK